MKKEIFNENLMFLEIMKRKNWKVVQEIANILGIESKHPIQFQTSDSTGWRISSSDDGKITAIDTEHVGNRYSYGNGKQGASGTNIWKTFAMSPIREVGKTSVTLSMTVNSANSGGAINVILQSYRLW